MKVAEGDSRLGAMFQPQLIIGESQLSSMEAYKAPWGEVVTAEGNVGGDLQLPINVPQDKMSPPLLQTSSWSSCSGIQQGCSRLTLTKLGWEKGGRRRCCNHSRSSGRTEDPYDASHCYNAAVCAGYWWQCVIEPWVKARAVIKPSNSTFQ